MWLGDMRGCEGKEWGRWVEVAIPSVAIAILGTCNAAWRKGVGGE